MKFKQAKRVKFILEFIDQFLKEDEIAFLFEKLLYRWEASKVEVLKEIEKRNEDLLKGCAENERLVQKVNKDLTKTEAKLKRTIERIEELENAE
tara:strand:- start:222 stop:503 length:282 start_codon:yes stop_codon:yes gene_type:complete